MPVSVPDEVAVPIAFDTFVIAVSNACFNVPSDANTAATIPAIATATTAYSMAVTASRLRIKELAFTVKI